MITPQIVYSPHYNISAFGVERLHPFDSKKYGRAWAAIHGRARSRWRRPSKPITDEALRLVHTPKYLESLKSSSQLANILEVPILTKLPNVLLRRRVLLPMRWAIAGTDLAMNVALKSGAAVNLGGGFHHAAPNRGGGFCVYNDIGIAIRNAERQGLISDEDRILYIDVDAHQGDGVAITFRDQSRVFIFDMYNAMIFPSDKEARRRIDCDVPLSSGTNDAEYLATLRSRLTEFVEALNIHARPRLAIVNAGTDIYRDDPLGDLSISAEAVLDRDKFILNLLTDHGLPWVYLTSGGYTQMSHKLIAGTLNYVLDGLEGRAEPVEEGSQ